VLVTEMKSPLGERALQEAIAQGFVTERGEKPSDLTISEENNGQKTSKKPSDLKENNEGKIKKPSDLKENNEGKSNKEIRLPFSEFPTMLTWNVYEAIKMNRKAKYSWLQDNLGVSESSIIRAINDLKELGYINKEHSKVKGEWQLLK
jgi:ATP-dependent DNA helicase RecG